MWPETANVRASLLLSIVAVSLFSAEEDSFRFVHVTEAPSARVAYSTSTDTSLRPCTPEEGGRLPPTYRGSSMLPTTFLRHSPLFPNWPPWHPGPCVVRDDVFQKGRQAEYAVHVNLWNRARQIRVTLIQLLKLTRGSWEMVLLDDGSTDDSLNVVHDVLDRYEAGWRACSAAENEAGLDVQAVWPEGTSEVFAGALGLECLQNGATQPTLLRVRVLRTPIEGLLPTFGNNLQMRLTSYADFHIIVDDDQFMSALGWNEWLATPLKQYSDVFSVSARCAHDWPDCDWPNCNNVGGKCRGGGLDQQHGFAWGLHVADSGNRGPLLIRGTAALELGFLDEVNFAGHWTTGCDHELNLRAYAAGVGVSGLVPIPYTGERCCRSPKDAAENREEEYRDWWSYRRSLGPPHDPFGRSHTHNHFRPLNITPLWAQSIA